jgi:nucleoside-diphosphate-sugar epimerase
MKQVLITGAGGFIGLHSVRRFVREGCFVYALVRKNIPDELRELARQNRLVLTTCDIRDQTALAAVFASLPRLDGLVHCAAKASDVGREHDFIATNYTAVHHLVALAKHNETGMFVFVSSTDVYGLHDFSGQTEEQLDYDTQASNPYPRYKILAEQWIRKELPPNRYCFIRPAAVWGEDDPTLTKRIRDFLRWSPWFVYFGPWRGTNRWPLAHVEHVALANYLGVFHPKAKGQAVNVLDSQWTSVSAFYRHVAETYYPGKRFAPLCLPLWVGILLGSVSTWLSNLCNTTTPLWDPTLYAVYTIGRNLDFSSQRFEELVVSFPEPVQACSRSLTKRRVFCNDMPCSSFANNIKE